MQKIFKTRYKCRICLSKNIKEAINFGNTIIAEKYLKDRKNTKSLSAPMRIFYCKNCSHVQMANVVDPNYLWNDFTFKTKNNFKLVNHFKRTAKKILNTVITKPEDCEVLDIGSNDGSLLKAFKTLKVKNVLGIDPAKNIVDEMEAIYDTCDGNYTFVDDVLTLNQNKTIELCDEIIKRGLGDKVKWNGMTRAEILGEKLVAKMAKAGCNDLFFGIESGSERVRTDVIAKKISNEEIKDAVSLCRKYGIVTNFFLMVGFPTETHEEIQETVEIGKKSGADMVAIWRVNGMTIRFLLK